jgi:hypothetical protein
MQTTLYTIYKTTNILDGKVYIGKHQTTDLNDGPNTVFSSGGGDGAGGTGNFSSVQDFMDIMTMRAASSLDVNPAINN